MTINKIIKKITKEYEEEKENILSEARTQKKDKIKKSRENIRIWSDNQKKIIVNEIREKYVRLYRAQRSSAKLDVNRFKKEIIDSVFERLSEYVLSLEKDEYQQFFLKFLDLESIKSISECYVGIKEKKIDKTFLKLVEKECKGRFSLKGTVDTFDYGILFKGETYDINLSYNEIMDMIKKRYLMEISGKLFE